MNNHAGPQVTYPYQCNGGETESMARILKELSLLIPSSIVAGYVVATIQHLVRWVAGLIAPRYGSHVSRAVIWGQYLEYQPACSCSTWRFGDVLRREEWRLPFSEVSS